MNKIRKGDDVIVRTGKDKGQRGTVMRLLENDRVIVEGVAMVKKHVKANPMQNQPGGIIEKESAINVSNVGILNPASGKADRVGIRTLEDGRKVRFFKSDGEVLDL